MSISMLIVILICIGHNSTHSLPHNNDLKPSYMLIPDYTSPLGQAIGVQTSASDKTGLHLLINGSDALNARIAMIKSAKRSLDIQYYIADADQSGNTILQAILKAAQRGVRVRILLDDLNFQDPHLVLTMLNSTKNIKVRVFNPFPEKGNSLLSRVIKIISNAKKLNRRMHNKTMIADNLAAIIGGRNLSDAYFDISQELNFRDIDLLALGRIVTDLSTNFDDFWNHSLSKPLNSLIKKVYSDKDLFLQKKKLTSFIPHSSKINHNVLFSQDPLDQQLKQKKIQLTWAKAKCWSDSPEKINKTIDKYVSPPAIRLTDLIQKAKKQVILVSAYFVPSRDGVELLTRKAISGVRINILTNSLASTDAPAVQSGYNRYRRKLLEHGISLFEFKPLSGKKRKTNILGSRSKASLHAKAYVIDHRYLLLGSFNFDPRSKKLNTELLIELDSEELSKKVNNLFDESTSMYDSYQVVLANKEDMRQLQESNLPISPLIWLSKENGIFTRHHYDPNANFMRNLISAIFTLLPLENQL